jgi:hypothetical protein
MDTVRRRLWWVLPALSIVLVMFGVSDVLIGIRSDPGITVAIIGLTPTELETVTTDGYRLADFMVRTQGLAIAAFGLLLTTVLLVPYRAAQRWAWYAAFILPAWAILVPLTYLVFGLAPGAQPAPPMISGPIFAAISVLLLVADRRRFVGPGGSDDALLASPDRATSSSWSSPSVPAGPQRSRCTR